MHPPASSFPGSRRASLPYGKNRMNTPSPFTSALLLCGLAALACSERSSSGPANASRKAPAPVVAPSPTEPASAPAPLAPSGFVAAHTAERFQAFLRQHTDAGYADLLRELAIEPRKPKALSFDPTGVRYFDRIDQQLKLTAEERDKYRQHGLVSVDHGQRYSMGSAYYAIYARDLPVLITTDSILHALHRSYDHVLQELEGMVFTPVLAEALEAAHTKLLSLAPELSSGALRDSAEDVDLYLTVARSLLRGAGQPPGSGTADPKATLRPRLAAPEQVEEILQGIAALRMERPDGGPVTTLYGGKRYIDYSQFRPRGHYTKTEELQRYFRAMMWLGRADTGFVLGQPDPRSALRVDARRETRSAALLTLVLLQSGQLEAVQSVSALIDALVGQADNVQLTELKDALEALGVAAPGALADERVVQSLTEKLSALGPQLVRSQVIVSPQDDPEKVLPPQLFQVFGQRFAIDSFVLSQVVYDSIVYQGQKQRRMMPAGLDVMAALGNDEAVRLLEPELGKFHYSANLLAARKTVDEIPGEHWSASTYQHWLGALRTLDDVPTGAFPEALRGPAWQRKQLQTQLASWSELRRDNVLYVKQSYTAFAMCEYPAGFVEPYPAFYDQLRALADDLVQKLKQHELRISQGEPWQRERVTLVRQSQVTFFERFRDTMRFLAHIARKELAGKPFTSEETLFLKKTVDFRGGGSGPPRYDGWYPKLVYGGSPSKWDPTVTDVHTDPTSERVLQAAVGDVSFLVVAIDNQGDRAAYVGPMYSYYEFTQPVQKRLTDEEWQTRIEAGQTPARPAFTEVFRAPTVRRELGPPAQDPPDPRQKEIQGLMRRASGAPTKELREQYLKRAGELNQELLRHPIPKTPEPSPTP